MDDPAQIGQNEAGIKPAKQTEDDPDDATVEELRASKLRSINCGYIPSDVDGAF